MGKREGKRAAAGGRAAPDVRRNAAAMQSWFDAQYTTAAAEWRAREGGIFIPQEKKRCQCLVPSSQSPSRVSPVKESHFLSLQK